MKQFITRLVKLTLILAAVITFSIFTKFSDSIPRQTIDKNAWFTDKFILTIPKDLPHAELWDQQFLKKSDSYVLLEAHSHTTVSDGSMCPKQLVDWAIAYGFDVLVVTDHNDITGGLQALEYAESERAELLVIPGVEYTCCRIHMNLIGIDETIKPTDAWPTDEELKEVIKRTHTLGGLVIVNHIPWSCSTEWSRQVPTLQTHPTRTQLLEWGVDGFESVSEGVIDLATVRFSESHYLPMITGTDVHSVDTAPNAWTVLKLSKNNLTQTKVLNALRKGNSSFYYDAVGPKPRVYSQLNPAYHRYAPMLALDMGFLWSENSGMYSFVDGFCHERRFQFFYSRAMWFVTWCFLGLVSYQCVDYLCYKHKDKALALTFKAIDRIKKSWRKKSIRLD